MFRILMGLVATNKASTEYFNFTEYNPTFKMDQACETYTDCYICTLANCKWDQNECF